MHKGELNCLAKKFEEFEENYSEVENKNTERARDAEEAERRAIKLQETIERYLKTRNFFHPANLHS